MDFESVVLVIFPCRSDGHEQADLVRDPDRYLNKKLPTT